MARPEPRKISLIFFSLHLLILPFAMITGWERVQQINDDPFTPKNPSKGTIISPALKDNFTLVEAGGMDGEF
jgi:hypothetical protein